MDSHMEAELDPPFEIHEPAECRGSVVFNSPHSGRVYPRAFLSSAKLDLATLRRSEDSFVDELLAGVVPPVDPRTSRFRCRRAGRLPLDALERGRQGRSAARRYRAR